MHQSRMFSSQRNHAGSMKAGPNSCPRGVARLLAICEQFTHHCGLSMGSMTSFVAAQTQHGVRLAAVQAELSSAATTAVLAAKRFIPEKRSPPSWFTSPSSSNTEMTRPCRLPVLKSFGSCAVIHRARAEAHVHQLGAATRESRAR